MLARGCTILVAAAALSLGSVALAPAAYVPAGDQLRVSHTGSDLDTTRGAADPDVAYNPDANEYLVVFYGNREPLAVGEFEVFGQRLNAAGQEIGDEFRISSVGAEGDADVWAIDPAVAYNTADDRYLVVYEADATFMSDEEFEIYGTTLNANGTVYSGQEDQGISSVGTAGETDQDGSEADVAYNSFNDTFLVTYSANHTSIDDDEILARQVLPNGNATGAQIPVSTPGNIEQDSYGASVAYNSAANEFLVAYARDVIAGLGDEFEIHGQRINGSTLGDLGGDFQTSQTGTPGNAAHDAHLPDLAYNPNGNEYLVAWTATAPPLAPLESEVFGQRVSASGNELGGTTDLRLSSTGTDGDVTRVAGGANVAFSNVQNEYSVTFIANPVGGATEFEVYGQRVSTGSAELGGDFRISTMGADGDASRFGIGGASAYNPATDEYLVTWYGDNLAADDKAEVWARRLGAPPALPPAGAPPQSNPGAKVKCKKKKAKKRAAQSAKKKCKKKKKKK